MKRLILFMVLWYLCFSVQAQTRSVRNISIATKTRLCPPRVGNGDREFSGNGPRVTATARLSMVGKTGIRLTLTLHAKETKSDWTEARGTWNYTVFTAPRGYKITRILSSIYSEATYTDNDHGIDIPPVNKGTLVSRFEIVGDTGGNDVGNCTSDDVYMNVRFNTVRIEIQKLEKIITSFGTNFDSPSRLVNKMSKDLNGLTHDNQFWYFTQDQGLWKISRSRNLATVGELVEDDMVLAEIPPFLLRRGYNKLGDLDHYQGFLWVSLEGEGRVAKRPMIAVFKTDNLELITTLSVHQWQNSIGCLAVHPSNGYLYASKEANTTFLNRYKITIAGDKITLAAPLRYNLKDKVGRAASLADIQGGAFSADGRYLFISEKNGTNGFLRSYNHRTGQEMYTANYASAEVPKGVTFWAAGSTIPGISGNLHLLVALPDPEERDAFTFRHYTIREGLDWNG